MKNVVIFDTTARDGEQAGHKMTAQDKLAFALQLQRLGVDVMEAGFPISSPGDAAAVKLVAKTVRGLSVCALARAMPDDIDVAWQSIACAAKPRIHTFISTSEVHMKKKLGKEPDEVLAMAVAAVTRAKGYCPDVEFSAEDATRSDPDFLAQIIKATIQAGSTTINLPDTVGYVMPQQLIAMLKYLYVQVPSLADVRLSMHCHNDLGLAVANSLAGISAGALQIEGTFLGIGERAGNAALEQVIMAIKTRQDYFQLQTGIDPAQLGPTCTLLANLIAYPIPLHQPIVGRGAFAHSSGIHAHGINRDRQTYEIMSPESVGWQGDSIQLVSHLGRDGLKTCLDRLGYDGAALVERVYPKFLALADIKSRLTDEDLCMIVQEIMIHEEIESQRLFDLVDQNKNDLIYGPGMGCVKIRRNGRTVACWANGDGPIDSLYQAINNAIAEHGENLDGLVLENWQPFKGEGGQEANAWVVVKVRQGNRIGIGRSGDPDTVKASAKAYIYAINHLLQCPIEEATVTV